MALVIVNPAQAQPQNYCTSLTATSRHRDNSAWGRDRKKSEDVARVATLSRCLSRRSGIKTSRASWLYRPRDGSLRAVSSAGNSSRTTAPTLKREGGQIYSPSRPANEKYIYRPAPRRGNIYRPVPPREKIFTVPSRREKKELPSRPAKGKHICRPAPS